MSDQDVITGEIASRYAKALYALANDSKSLKKVEKDVAALKKMFESHADLRRLVTNPVYATHDKTASLVAVAKKAKLSPLTVKFVGTVAQNRRAEELVNICRAFEDIMARERGSKIAKVTSATKLTATQLNSLKASLKKSLGQKVDVETHIDPDLLGGFVVRIGSRLYDSSLKTQLEDLRITLKEV